MKKVFISQPMSGYAMAEILSEREIALKMAEKIMHENLMLIDTYFPDEYKKGINVQDKVITAIIDADVVVFARGWFGTSGCEFEHGIAERLDKPIIELGERNANLINLYRVEE